MPRPRQAGKRDRRGRLLPQSEDDLALAEQAGNLAARCRAMGLDPTPANLRMARSQMWGCNAGRACIGQPDAAELYQAVQHVRRVIVRHDWAIGAPRRHAVCLRLLTPVDAMEARDDTTHDDRSEEDRARSAVTAWTRLHGWLWEVTAAGEVMAVCVEDAAVKDKPRLLAGLRRVTEGIRGRK